jgi:hypothetical protein
LPGNGPVHNLQVGALQQYQTYIARQRAVNKFLWSVRRLYNEVYRITAAVSEMIELETGVSG